MKFIHGVETETAVHTGEIPPVDFQEPRGPNNAIFYDSGKQTGVHSGVELSEFLPREL